MTPFINVLIVFVGGSLGMTFVNYATGITFKKFGWKLIAFEVAAMLWGASMHDLINRLT